MAWLQQLPSGKFHISFRFGGRKYKRSLGTSDPPQAKSRKVRLEDTIRLVENGMAEIPAVADVATFLTFDAAGDAIAPSKLGKGE